MSRLRTMRKRNTFPDGPWKAEIPFGPPRTSSFPGAGMRRLRSTLFKLSPAASAEREALKETNHRKLPLTEKNIDTFVLEQQLRDAGRPNQHNTELQVSAWLEKLS
ncbi:hypothetical protein PHISP_05189 [Aspergillus sp. HF37]|nr:hypothetical protein PHISP_05189 [Aspergillus sp. HF37]